jgi:hypothetical protein
MPDKSSHTDTGLKGIADDVRQYVEKRLELFAMTISEQVSFILADSIQRLIGILLISCGFLIAWFALSYLVSELVGSYSLGFFISSLPLIIGGMIFLKVKPKSVTRVIQAGIIHEVMLSFDEIEEQLVKKEESKKGEE